MSKVIKKIFKIEGMHCTSCAMNIDFDLEDMTGIKSAKTSYAKQVCEVEYDIERISEDAIIDLIKNTGYKAVVEEK